MPSIKDLNDYTITQWNGKGWTNEQYFNVRIINDDGDEILVLQSHKVSESLVRCMELPILTVVYRLSFHPVWKDLRYALVPS